MLSTEEFYQTFDDAGFLKQATWVPKNGSATVVGKVRFRAPTRDVLAGDQASNDFSIEYPASLFGKDFRRDETVSIASTPADARVDGDYFLRKDPESQLDGSVYRAYLGRIRP